MAEEVGSIDRVADDRKNQLADDDIKRPAIEPGGSIGGEVRFGKPQRAARGSGDHGQFSGGGDRIRADVDPQHGKSLLEKPSREPPGAAPDIEELERGGPRYALPDSGHEPVELWCGILARDRAGVEMSPVFTRVSYRHRPPVKTNLLAAGTQNWIAASTTMPRSQPSRATALQRLFTPSVLVGEPGDDPHGCFPRRSDATYDFTHGAATWADSVE